MTSGVPSGPRADLVLEGPLSAVPALAGAVDELLRAGLHVARIAASGGGALVAAAALDPRPYLRDLVEQLDLGRLLPPARSRRRRSLLSPNLDLARLLDQGEVGRGEVEQLRSRVGAQLASAGVRTFADLRLVDPGSDLPPGRSSRLVLLAYDLTRQTTVRLPWDFPSLGLDPDEQVVAEAVVAATSMAFQLPPVHVPALSEPGRRLVAAYPLAVVPELFDRSDGRPPRWPTLVVRTVAREPATESEPGPDGVPVHRLLLEAAACGPHLADPPELARAVLVDMTGWSATRTTGRPEEADQLWRRGVDASARFLESWSFADDARG